MKEQLKSMLAVFVASVTKYRPLDIDKTCNGDHWTAQQSVDLNLGLVDVLMTSQEYLLQVNQTRKLIYLSEKASFLEQAGLGRAAMKLADFALNQLTQSKTI